MAAVPAFQIPDAEMDFAASPLGTRFFRIENFGCGEADGTEGEQGKTVDSETVSGGGS